MSRKPERELRVMVNRAKCEIEVILLANDSPQGSVAFTQEQAEDHARTVIRAIEMLQEGRSKLIAPDPASGLTLN